MADTAVDIFLDTLEQLITSSKLGLIIEEKHQLQFLVEKIKYLRGFLKVTEKTRNEEVEVMNLVTRIREVVSDAENIVELFVIHAFKAHDVSCSLQENHDHHLHLDLESVKKEIETLIAEVNYDEITYETKGVPAKKHRDSSSKSGSIVGVTGSSGGSKDTSKSEVIKEKELVVGFEDEVTGVLEKLQDEQNDGTLEIINITGTGGGGKTTLAKEVYYHSTTSDYFQIRAWVDVSQGYDKTMKRDLLIRIFESASPGKHANEKDDKLEEDIFNCLKTKKYLIVMDDIWGVEAWNDIQKSIPKKGKGGKVLFTSRLNVQPDGIRWVGHELGRLTKKASWELLQKKVFGIECCPLNLVPKGKKIAEKCDGLPLAILSIAGILATEEKTIDVWTDVANRLSSIIAEGDKRCMEILEFSYNHLPLHLKACFLYIGGFTEDYEIIVQELTWLWIAEGLIQQSEGRENLEAVAKDYLISLIGRNLVMVARKSSLGRIKACRIHDLMRELCLKKVEECNFLARIDEKFSASAEIKHRRLFIGYQFFNKFSSTPPARSLRSFLCLKPKNPLPSSFEQNFSFFAKNFELLRVLSFFSGACQGEIGVGHLVHLRYLALKLQTDDYSCWSYATPFSYLYNLETLNLQVSRQVDIELPRNIFKMVRLRHLYSKSGLFNYHVGSNLTPEEAEKYGFDSSSKLDSLQTLHRICCCLSCRRFLESTPSLRKLGLYGRIEDNGVLMIPDLGFLEHLESLSFTSIIRTDKQSATLPRDLKLPQTVTRLTLTNTLLEWEELSILPTGLPNLEVLILLHACSGPTWNTSEYEVEFSKLKYLRIKHLHIEEWTASNDQFPILEVLVLEYCQKLERIPNEFAYLSELREIKVEWSTRSVEESAKEIEQERNERYENCLQLLTLCNRY